MTAKLSLLSRHRRIFLRQLRCLRQFLFGRLDYPARADDYFTRVANIYVEVSPLGVATAERRAADGAQCVPGPFLLRMTFKYLFVY